MSTRQRVGLRVLHGLRAHSYPIVLVLITLFVCFWSFTPGTWLTGWDTLHPEFDFGLNFSRIMQGVWRSEQGLGAVAAHAHMSELPRYVLLWIASWFVPISSLRYAYIFLCFITGPLGMYYCINQLLRSKHHEYHIVRHVAFLGALFYICNRAVIHHFLVPFEMFPTLYALMPWIFLCAVRYMEAPSRTHLLWFAVCTLFSTPMAYAFQLWYVFMFSLFLFLLMISLQNKSISSLKRALILLVITMGIHSFWFLPHLYFLWRDAQFIPLAHSNLLFSERMFALNKARGDLKDVFMLQGALYDWSKFDGTSFVPLFNVWKAHLENPIVLLIGYGAIIAVVCGSIRSILTRNRYGRALLPVGICAFIFLANMSWPFDGIFGLVRNLHPVIKEGLRSPYTKFSLTLLFVFSFFFASLHEMILRYFSPKLRLIYVLNISFVLIVTMYPLFTGNLIDTSMKLKIPTEYFQMFAWFKKQPASDRIATFPLHSFWGWEYYRWGYQGAGFVWFGLPQSVLVRDFDRWNPANENFYWEFSYAVYSKRTDLIVRVLNKYRVNWLLVDRNIISPPNPQSLYFDEFDDLVSHIPEIEKKKSFGNISIYSFKLKKTANAPFIVLNRPSRVFPTYAYNNDDQAYGDHEDYVSENQSIATYAHMYPFRSLFTGRSITSEGIDISSTQDAYVVTSSLPWDPDIPNTYEITTLSSGAIPRTDSTSLEEYGSVPTSLVNNHGFIAARVPFISDYYTYDSTNDSQWRAYLQNSCDHTLTGSIHTTWTNQGGRRFESLNASNCLDIRIPQLDHKYSYLVQIEAHNITGSPILFSIQNIETHKSEAETYLPKDRDNSMFIVPPLAYDGKSYALHFDSISIGQEKTVNELIRVRVQRFPYEFLHSLQLTPKQQESSREVVYFPQRFEKGWLAYDTTCPESGLRCMAKKNIPFLFAHRLHDHVLVNNWANGWKSEGSTFNNSPQNNLSFSFIFWPQYLEYCGLIISFGIMFFLLGSVRSQP